MRDIHVSQPSIRKNFIFRLLYEMLVFLTPFITTPYIARVLGSDGAGITSYTGSVMSFFTLFAALGTSQYGMREIARHRDNPEKASKLFWEIELLTAFTSLVCLAGWIILCICWEEYRIYFLVLTPRLFSTMFDISWFFTAHEKVGYTVGRNAFFKILGIVLLVTLVKSKADLGLSIFLSSFTGMLGNLTMWTFLPKLLVKVDFRTFRFRHHFHETLVYFIPTIANTISAVLDKFLLGLLIHNFSLSGYYAHANKLMGIVNSLVITSMFSVMQPRVSWLFARGKTEEIRRRIGRAMDFSFLLGLGCVFGVAGVAHVFVPVFWGPGWEPVETLLYLMCPITIIVSVSYCLGGLYYNPSGNRAQSARYVIIDAAINTVLNLLLIPRWNAVGAVIATIVAEGITTVLYVQGCRGYLNWGTIGACFWKRFLAGALMCVLVMLIGRIPMGSDILKLVLQILSGVVIYAGILYLWKDAMLKEILDVAKNVLKKAWGMLRGSEG